MRKLHFLLYKAFFGPFFLTFFVANFMLLMIWLWKWMEDIIGRGLDFDIILELIGYASLNQIPMSLPLAVLVSSIMAFGKLGETVELTAIKSLGVSLWKAMSPLIGVVLLTCALAFLFSNNVLPYSNGKLKLLLRDITMKKPDLSIPEGSFYSALRDHTIRVEKKYPDRTLKNIVIFKDKNDGKNTFIVADSGKMELANGGRHLLLTLINGSFYEQQEERVKPKQKKKFPLVRNDFETNTISFDLSDFKFVQSEENIYKGDSKMRNLLQLEESIDSIGKQIVKRKNQLLTDLNQHFYFRPDSNLNMDLVVSQKFDSSEFILNIPAKKRAGIIQHALDIARNTKNYITSAEIVTDNQEKIQVRHKIEWHKKFTLSFACLVMFFIGAPFGAIVRKGGLGTPVVIGIILFIAFHVITVIGDKTAKKMEIEPHIAIWLACIILTPIGLFLTYKATSDSDLFSVHAYKNFFSKFTKPFKKRSNS